MNTLYQGDNLSILQNLPDASVDLIATDPPFNTGKNWGAFDDRWEGGLKGYLKFMEQRAVEMHRVLKDTGSLYLHCDPTASHYLKVMLDGVFGIKQFRNEIVWKRTNAHNDSSLYGKIHDILLYYSKSTKPVCNKQYIRFSADYLARFNKVDQDGRKFTDITLTAESLSGGGYEYEWNCHNRVWQCPIETMEKHNKTNRLYYTKNGMPRLKSFLDERKGLAVSSVWDDVNVINSQNKERVGYPTQKPIALYERIIKASSNQSDIVLDPFAGSGTTLDASQSLGRRWIGIDQSTEAIETIQRRLEARHGILVEYELIRGE